MLDQRLAEVDPCVFAFWDVCKTRHSPVTPTLHAYLTWAFRLHRIIYPLVTFLQHTSDSRYIEEYIWETGTSLTTALDYHFFNLQQVVSIQRCHHTSIRFPIIKITHSWDSSIFKMGTPTPGKMAFIVNQALVFNWYFLTSSELP